MSDPRVFYYSYDHQSPKGGQKHTYQHVDVLNRNGIEAYILHRSPGFRLTWFDNRTPVMDEATFRRIHDPARDYVVLPEDLGPRIFEYPGRKVIFNKGLYLGCRALFEATVDPYRSSEVVGVFAVSEHNARHLRFAYPSAAVSVVSANITPEQFPFLPLHRKKPQIACACKAMNQVVAVAQMLRARADAGLNRTAELEWVFLKDLPEQQVGAVLSESLIFMFLSVEEGTMRFPSEAMASGCLTIVYDNGPFREFLPEGVGFEYGDHIGIMSFIEKIAAASPDERRAYQPLVDRCRTMAAKLSPARQEETVLQAWREVFARSATAALPGDVPADRSNQPGLVSM